ncbi:ADP-ribosylglycohydrolase family protein [Candidatus Poriferisodalis sp.]|uniref:ADP-ribosylglycohydrolase family protein n=1 Tax=Candidatus Poriferisodalis sp. TaxID=3101277 RepID=UPI003B028D81
MTSPNLEQRIRSAWIGRISGCMLGKPVELLSMRQGPAVLHDYLAQAGALPLRDYVPLLPQAPSAVERNADACKDRLVAAVPDDDINYTVLSLMLIEEHGTSFTTEDVARAWFRWLPGGLTFTAERAAYAVLMAKASTPFAFGQPAGFDLDECSDNEFNDWIGAQIRADMYGWVAPGEPALAVELAARDARLSHRGEGVYGAQAVAAIGAAIPSSPTMLTAIEAAMELLPAGSACVDAMALGIRCATADDGPAPIHRSYDGMSPVHTVNNLALVTWGLLSGEHDFSAAIGDTVAAGCDTDCNGATVGALWGLSGRPISAHWPDAWNGRVQVSLAGVGELALDDLVTRTLAVCP